MSVCAPVAVATVRMPTVRSPVHTCRRTRNALIVFYFNISFFILLILLWLCSNRFESSFVCRHHLKCLKSVCAAAAAAANRFQCITMRPQQMKNGIVCWSARGVRGAAYAAEVHSVCSVTLAHEVLFIAYARCVYTFYYLFVNLFIELISSSFCIRFCPFFFEIRISNLILRSISGETVFWFDV